MPSVLRRTDDGPMIWVQDSAVICGGIIIGIMRQNTNAALARRFVNATRNANAAPSTSDTNVPNPAVTSECLSALKVEGCARTSAISARLGRPSSVTPSTKRRSTGASVRQIATTRMAESSRASDRLPPFVCVAPIIRRRKALRILLCWFPRWRGLRRDQKPST